MSNRYSRQELFSPIGKGGQQKIKNSHVFILGCGALGTACAESLTRAGVGKITLVDRDYVELSNLQRQHLFSEQDVIDELPKVVAAKNRLEQINHEVEIQTSIMDATTEDLSSLLEGVDVAIDATDNFDVRLMMNDLFHQMNIPWIYGSCVSSSGMSFTIIPGESPCLHCILEGVPMSLATCDSVGIISPAVQMVVAHQVTEALKILVGDQEALRTRLVTFDLWQNRYHQIKMDQAKKEHCQTCGKYPSYGYLTYGKQTKTEVLCGRDTVQIRPRQAYPLTDLAKRFHQLGEVKSNSFLLSLRYEKYRLVFFKDGRTLIHGTESIEEAKKIYYQLVG